MIYLKDFVLKIAEEKELKLLDRTKSFIKGVEIVMIKNRKEMNPNLVVGKLKQIQELHKEFDKKDWNSIEKEVGKMI